MHESAAKMTVEYLAGKRSLHVHKDDSAFFSFTRIKADDAKVEHRFEASAATLCFIRGTGKIVIHDSLFEYGGKWFDIPLTTEYQIFPETDTVMLAIQKPTGAFVEVNDDLNRRHRS